MKKRQVPFIIIVSTGLTLLAGVAVYAASSATYSVEFSITSQLGAFVQWAIPEGRVGANGTNWDTTYYVSVHKANDPSDTVYETTGLATTTVAGENLNPVLLSTITPGTYDVLIKTNQHLSRRLKNVLLVDGTNALNFTQTDNTVPGVGPVRLLAGDVSGAGNSVATLGDNVVNSVDLNIMLGDIDKDDPTAHADRANLNQDTVVNAVDLSLMIGNLDKQGE
jgi:hypothetical protein